MREDMRNRFVLYDRSWVQSLGNASGPGEIPRPAAVLLNRNLKINRY